MLRGLVARTFLFPCALGAFVFASTSAQAKVVTLQHDTLTDNAEAAAVCGFAVGERFGASFTPPDYPAKLLKVRVFLAPVGLGTTTCDPVPAANDIEMPLEVFQVTSTVPGSSLGTFDGLAFSNDSVLNEIDVGASNLSIDDGAFMVAYTINQSNASPAHDASNAADNAANFIYADLGAGADWYSFAQLTSFGLNPKGDWIIRIDVDVPDGPGPDGGTGGTAGAAGSGGSAGQAGSGGQAGSAGQAGTGGASPGCSKDTECTGGQLCDTDLGKCVQVSCTTDPECEGGYVCREQSCRKICDAISDCRGGEACKASGGVSICVPSSSSGAPADSGDSGGCAASPRGRVGAYGVIGLALALWLASRRRRRPVARG